REGQRMRTLDNRSRASNPGRVTVQLPVLAACYRARPILWAIGVLASVGLGIAGEWRCALAMALIVGLHFHRSVLIARERFWFGDVNPAAVISHDPDRIAVYGDLRTGHAAWPVVKVLAHPLKRMAGGRPAVG